MTEAQPSYSSKSSSEFADLARRLLTKLGYSVNSVRLEGDEIEFKVRAVDPLNPETALVHVFRDGKPVPKKTVEALYSRLEAENFSKLILVSESRFSKSCLKYAEPKQIQLIGGAELSQLLESHNLSSGELELKTKSTKVYEKAFKLGMGEAEARKRFSSKWLLERLVSPREHVVEVEGRFYPLGVFHVERTEETVSSVTKTVRKAKTSNTFCVNMHDGSLYFHRKGFLGKKPHLDSYNIITVLSELPYESIQILAEVYNAGELSFDALNREHYLFVQENMDKFLVLQTKGLIEVKSSLGYHVYANVDLPEFSNPKYDLEKYLGVEESIESDYLVDVMEYSPDAVLELLELLFSGKGEFRGVIYMPYFKCKYVDDRNRFRYSVVLAPEFKPAE